MGSDSVDSVDNRGMGEWGEIKEERLDEVDLSYPVE